VLRAVEAAKRHLSSHPFAKIEEEFIAEKDGEALHLNEEIPRDLYETLIRSLLDRTTDCVQRALDDAHLNPSQINKVVLVGGSTRTPLVSAMLEERLGQPAHQEVNPDLCVAMGASIQAAIISGQNVGSVLVDITPHSLGIKCLDEFRGYDFPFRFAPVIHRNTPLPASRSEAFHTVMDRQERVEIDVYQGENDDVRNNHNVGKFTIEGLAKVPAGNQIVVQMDLTLDGILKVSARERATGLQKAVTIQNALAAFERDERAAATERLRDLWDDLSGPDELPEDLPPLAGSANEMPELVPGPREGQREAVQARALLEKAERLIQRVAAEDRADIERMMEKVRTALTDRQWARVHQASNELADALFYLEDA
jgi:molecular chaperone DnaK